MLRSEHLMHGTFGRIPYLKNTRSNNIVIQPSSFISPVLIFIYRILEPCTLI